MKYCEYCHRPLEDDQVCTCQGARAAAEQKKNHTETNTICPYCGKSLGVGEVCNCPGSVEAEKARANAPVRDGYLHILGFRIPMRVVALLACLFVVWGVLRMGINAFRNRTLKLDWTDYVTVEFSGIDSRGTAELSVDWEAMEDSLPAARRDVFYGVDVTLNREENLSNGNRIQAKIHFPQGALKEYRVKLREEQMEWEVTGLLETTPLDVFQDLEVSFDGIDGFGSPVITCQSQNPFIRTVRFSPEQNKGLKNGDQVNILAEYDQEEADRQLIGVPEIYRTYTVSGLSSYVTALGELDSECLERLDQECRDHLVANTDIYEYRLDYKTYEILSVEPVNTYVFCKKEITQQSEDNSCIARIYRVTVTGRGYSDEEDRQETVYYLCGFQNLVKHPDGKVEFDLEPFVGTKWWDTGDSVQEIYQKNLAKYAADYSFSQG